MAELSPLRGEPGAFISHYRIVQKIRSGGMGEVYLAEDLMLPRVVALKLLPESHRTDPILEQRLMREARAASVLNHANIARVYEAGRGDDQVFVAMEYVEGETLDRRIGGAGLTIEEVVRLAAQLASALEHAHQNGVVHRDIKPSNLMITPQGELKVLDFGLAKFDDTATAPMDGSTEFKTDSGMVMGTAPYMSPEQALGKPADHRSDIFSAGAVLYEMVTQRRAFKGSSTTDTLYKVVNAQPEAIARFNYDVPVELERIIRKALEKEPQRRYQNARDLLVDLQNLARDRHLSLDPYAAASRLWRRRSVVLALLVLVVVAGSLLWKRTITPAAPIRSVAILPLQNRAGPASAALVDGLDELMIGDLARLPGLRVIGPSTSAQYRSAKSPLEAGRAMSVDAIISGSVRRSGDTLTVLADLLDVRSGSKIKASRIERPAVEVFALAEELASDVARALHVNMPPRGAGPDRNVSPVAYELYVKGRREWNKRDEKSLPAAIDLFRQTIEVEPAFALAYAGLADSYTLLERYTSTRSEDSKARATAAAARAIQLDPFLPEAHVALGSVRETYEWDWKGAEQEYRTAIRLSPSYATAHHWLALLLTRVGNLDAALNEIKIARQLDPLSPAIAAAEANIHYYHRSFGESVTAARTALQLKPDFAMAQLQLALALEFVGERASALHALDEMPAAYRAQAAAVGAVIRGRAGDRDAAERFLQPVQQRPDAAMHAYAIAAVHASIGDPDTALQWLEQARQARSFWIGYVAVDPLFDVCHANPKFNELTTGLRLSGHE